MTDTAAPATSAVATPEPIKETKHISDLERRLALAQKNCDEAIDKGNLLRGELQVAKSDIGNLQYQLETERQSVKDAENGEKQARGEAKRQRDTIAELRAHLAADPNLQELQRLRAEVASMHRKNGELQVKIDDAITERRIAYRDRETAQIHFRQLEGTAETMQRARDAAQLRESQAFQRVAELDRDLAAAIGSAAALEALAEKLADQVNAVSHAHQKGHPAAIAGCAICSALGREVSPEASVTTKTP